MTSVSKFSDSRAWGVVEVLRIQRFLSVEEGREVAGLWFGIQSVVSGGVY